jgi:hypothetical protein
MRRRGFRDVLSDGGLGCLYADALAVQRDVGETADSGSGFRSRLACDVTDSHRC